MSVSELAAAMYEGASLGEITEARGKDVNGLINEVFLVRVNSVLTLLAEQGILTPEQAEKIYGAIELAAGFMIYRTVPCLGEAI